MVKARTIAAALSITTFLNYALVFGCDLCALYRSSQSVDAKKGAMHLSLSEQFTRYDRIQREGKSISNPAGERFSSSQTRIDGSYDLSDRFSLRASIPFVSKRYHQLKDGKTESGTESGFGDIAITSRFEAVNWQGDSGRFKLSAFAGVELPTGDADLLKEDHHEDQEVLPDHEDELEEHDHAEDHDEETHDEMHLKHSDQDAEIESAVHGHDLALGSGSVDFPLGIGAEWVSGRLSLTSHLEYTIRTEGDHNYEYADDLSWLVGVGGYPSLSDDYSILVRANIGGEHKEKDEVDGEKEDDTKIRTLFAGPEIVLSSSDNLSVNFSADVPLDINNSGTQAVMDYRLRGGLTWRF